ncbi:O-antigen/teichoic acid export membrane protein [Clostridium beijerinckii]|nr:O-antigen/teichoic acid export membrane protein [Clostridium beijerinckii]
MNKQKSMVINFIYNFLYTSLNIIFPLITLPYASRIIGVSGIGKVNFSNSIVNYFLIFASLGIPNYGIMAIAKLRDDTKKLSKTFSEIFL